MARHNFECILHNVWNLAERQSRGIGHCFVGWWWIPLHPSKIGTEKGRGYSQENHLTLTWPKFAGTTRNQLRLGALSMGFTDVKIAACESTRQGGHHFLSINDINVCKAQTLSLEQSFENFGGRHLHNLYSFSCFFIFLCIDSKGRQERGPLPALKLAQFT